MMNLNKHTFVAKMSYVVKYALFKGVLMKITTLSPQKLILGGGGGDLFAKFNFSGIF